MASDEVPAEALARARTLHSDAREEINRADAKATTLLSVVGLLLGALVAGAIAGDWGPQKLDNSVEWIFWLASALAVGGAGHLLAAVFPRIDHPDVIDQPRYFGHVVQFDQPEALRAALLHADTEFDQHVDQVWNLSAIVDAKYSHIKSGLKWFTIGVVAAALAVGLDHLLS